VDALRCGSAPWVFVRGRLSETPILKVGADRLPHIRYSFLVGQVTKEDAWAGFGQRFFCFIFIFVSLF